MLNLHSKWIFSLFVRLEKPLYQDVAADIREIYRLTCRARADLEYFINTLVQQFSNNNNSSINNSNNSSNNSSSNNININVNINIKDSINRLHQNKNKSSNSKGSVRFIGIQDDENDENFKERDNDGNSSENNSSGNNNNSIFSIEDLTKYSFELASQAEIYLAGINMMIVICGKYFGQEEYEVRSDFSGYEDDEYNEENEEEEYDDEYDNEEYDEEDEYNDDNEY